MGDFLGKNTFMVVKSFISFRKLSHICVIKSFSMQNWSVTFSKFKTNPIELDQICILYQMCQIELEWDQMKFIVSMNYFQSIFSPHGSRFFLDDKIGEFPFDKCEVDEWTVKVLKLQWLIVRSMEWCWFWFDIHPWSVLCGGNWVRWVVHMKITEVMFYIWVELIRDQFSEIMVE